MKIAIHATELDQDRVDGNRVYLLNLLRNFGQTDRKTDFILYHKSDFNPELTPPDFSNYKIRRLEGFPFWTQTLFPKELSKDGPDVLWMSIQAIPFFLPKLKSVVTIHDLAPKIFPKYFKFMDRVKLNLYLNLAIRRAGKLIAVSENTKRDILKFYPEIPDSKIKVIYHGFDSAVFSLERNIEREKELKNKLGITGDYVLYSGAIQPRKNLEVLIEAFEILKRKTGSPIKLVLAGGNAWLWEKIVKKAENSYFKADIIMPGKLKFGDLGHLMRGAGVYVYPSLYEGFGITLLEALAAKVPLITASNSSLPEVGGSAAAYFDADDPAELAEKIEQVLGDADLRKQMIEKGTEQIKKFSWEKCARETLDYLKS